MGLTIRQPLVPSVAPEHLVGCAPDLQAALGRGCSFLDLTTDLAASKGWVRAYAEAVLHRYLALGRALSLHPDSLGLPPVILCIVAAEIPVDDVKGIDPVLLHTVAIEFMARLKPVASSSSTH
jgi:hypothetical protein